MRTPIKSSQPVFTEVLLDNGDDDKISTQRSGESCVGKSPIRQRFSMKK